MRVIDYDKKEKGSGNTEIRSAADEPVDKIFGNIQNALEEGFAASDGIRAETAESDGRVRNASNGDSARAGRTRTFIGNQNPGLADN
jgi:hypothetical protein